MQFSLLESLHTLGNMQNFDLPFPTWVLGLQISNKLSLFSRVNPTGSDNMSHNRERLFLDSGMLCYHSCSPSILLQVVFG